MSWVAQRWHYRRSLASRVALLTTMAVGASIALMALGAFMVMRMQLQSALDESLLNRATKAAESTALSEVTVRGAPAWMLGAADVRVIDLPIDDLRNHPRDVIIANPVRHARRHQQHLTLIVLPERLHTRELDATSRIPLREVTRTHC